MRIVAVADTHLFVEDLGQLPDGDLFIHAGDLCRGGTLEELAEAAAWLRGLPHPTKIVVAGNHDWSFVRDPAAARALLDGVTYLQDAGVTIEGLRFWGSPWQPAFNDWAFNLPRGPAIRAKWDLIPEGTDVLITHGPPAGIGDTVSDSRRTGCADLLAAVRRVRPMLHLFGHIHQDGGFWRREDTSFANVTTWECERGATVIDVEPGAVREVVIPPRQ